MGWSWFICGCSVTGSPNNEGSACSVFFGVLIPLFSQTMNCAKAIAMGLGFTKNDQGRFCDPDSRYANEQASYNVSSMVNRFKTFYTVDSYSTREFADAKAFGQSVIDESITIEREQGQMMDADCRPDGKNISFERLLLNAPQIQSRYEGNFQGVIIAEIAIMRLGDFKFKYDPVFKTTPILPFVNQAEVLMVTNDLNSN